MPGPGLVDDIRTWLTDERVYQYSLPYSLRGPDRQRLAFDQADVPRDVRLPLQAAAQQTNNRIISPQPLVWLTCDITYNRATIGLTGSWGYELYGKTYGGAVRLAGINAPAPRTGAGSIMTQLGAGTLQFAANDNTQSVTITLPYRIIPATATTRRHYSPLTTSPVWYEPMVLRIFHWDVGESFVSAGGVLTSIAYQYGEPAPG